MFMPVSTNSASVTGPTIGMRYSTLPTMLVSPPGYTSRWIGNVDGVGARARDCSGPLGTGLPSGLVRVTVTWSEISAVGEAERISKPRRSVSPPWKKRSNGGAVLPAESGDERSLQTDAQSLQSLLVRVEALHRNELLELANRTDVSHVAADAGNIHADKVAAPAVRTQRIVDRAAAEARNQLAGHNSLQRVRAADVAECQELENNPWRPSRYVVMFEVSHE